MLHLHCMTIHVARCVQQDTMCTGPARLAVTEEHAACLGMLAMPTLEHNNNNNNNNNNYCYDNNNYYDNNNNYKIAFQLMRS